MAVATQAFKILNKYRPETKAEKKERLTKNEMAKRMHTSRSQLDRILDPNNDKIQLDTVFKAARALGREVKLELV